MKVDHLKVRKAMKSIKIQVIILTLVLLVFVGCSNQPEDATPQPTEQFITPQPSEQFITSHPEEFTILYTADGVNLDEYKISEMDSFYRNKTWYIDYDQLGDSMFIFWMDGDESDPFHAFKNGIISIAFPANTNPQEAHLRNENEEFTTTIEWSYPIIFESDKMYIPIEHILISINNYEYTSEGMVLNVQLITDVNDLCIRYKEPLVVSSVESDIDIAIVEIPKFQTPVKSNITRLTETLAEFIIKPNFEYTETHNGLIAQIKSVDYIFENEIEGNEDYTLSVDDLLPDTEYSLNIVDKSSHKLYDQIQFKTFTGNKNDSIELHYFADFRESDTEIVTVQIIGRYNNISDYSFHGEIAHSPVDAVRIIDDSMICVLDGNYKYNPKDVILDMNFDNNSGYFSISYLSDKSFKGLAINGIGEPVGAGFMNDYCFFAIGAQFLIIPHYKHGGDNTGTNISMITNPDWDSIVGFSRSSLDNLYEVKDIRFTMGETNYYAYRKDSFRVSTKNIYDTDVTVVVDKRVARDYTNEFFKIYERLCDYWGESVNKGTYTLGIFDEKRDVTIGEYDTGQAVPSTQGLHTITHQVYHIWNGWSLGIPLEHERVEMGLWGEGFNEFYIDKVLNEIQKENSDSHLEGYYYEYLRAVNNGNDIPILDHGSEVYTKGAAYAYALDEEIRRKSNGLYSNDDIIQYFLTRWIEEGKAFSFETMLSFLRDSFPGGVDDWWEEHVINNVPVEIDFED